MVTRIALLGSTGSVGTQTLDVVEQHPELFEIVTIAAHSNLDALREQMTRHRPKLVVANVDTPMFDGIEALPTPEGLVAAATHPDVDLVVFATSGHDAIPATIAAIEAGKEIALANKEAIICAGDLIVPLARKHGVTIRPVDSEHSAIWQCLASGDRRSLRRIMLTASGGPFRTTPTRELAAVTYQQALKHPSWNMGTKITIDSATLVNKGLELIEAHHLFDVPLDHIDVVVHPESIIHSMVEFEDGNTIAQMSFPDMRLPIQYALTYPQRVHSNARSLDLPSLGSLTFEEPDTDKFPALRIAREAGQAGRSCPTVYSAADEVAVRAFADGRISFPRIALLIQRTLERHHPHAIETLEDVLAADRWARAEARQLVDQFA
jgi:1-deoxy-D-xylulose-5-phosphate reductoisomerase